MSPISIDFHNLPNWPFYHQNNINTSTISVRSISSYLEAVCPSCRENPTILRTEGGDRRPETWGFTGDTGGWHGDTGRQPLINTQNLCRKWIFQSVVKTENNSFLRCGRNIVVFFSTRSHCKGENKEISFIIFQYFPNNDGFIIIVSHLWCMREGDNNKNYFPIIRTPNSLIHSLS